MILRAACFIVSFAGPAPDSGREDPVRDQGSNLVEQAELGPVEGAPLPPHMQAERQRERESAREVEARELYIEGYTRFELADFAGAIQLWERAYELLPASRRGDLSVQLANAHKSAYDGGDEDPEHLRRARVLFRAHLSTLDASAQEVRVEVEAELAIVEAELAAIKAENDQREQALAAVEAETTKKIVTQQLQEIDPWTDDTRRHFRLSAGFGGGVTGLGAACWGIAIASMALGEQTDKEGNTLAPDVPYEAVQAVREKGVRYNTMAYAFGAIGGVLVISGVVLVVDAAILRKRATDALENTKPSPVAFDGMRLRF